MIASFITPLLHANSPQIQDYDLLIITPDIFEDELESLVVHKNSMGLRTKLVTLSKVYDEMFWNGRDNQEKIKYFIYQAYTNWHITYVLLIGDYRKMPIRYVYNNEPSEYDESRYISELYYADIVDAKGKFSSWNSNNNEYFGEWIGSKAQDYNIDLRPDVYVGRLACRNNNEVSIMVRKIIHYEKETSNQEWFNRFVVVAGDTYPPGQYPFDTAPYEGEENTLNAIENMTGFDVIKLWASTGAFTGPKDVISVINKGCGIMFFDGHASPIAWGTHPPEIEKNGTWIWGLKNYHIPLLHNGYKLPVIVAGACHNAQFDVTPFNLLKVFEGKTIHPGEWALECWAWKLVSQSHGGAIAVFSNTGLGMSKEDKVSQEGAGDYMDLQFFVEYGTNNSQYLGEIWAKAINRYINQFPVDWNNPAGSDAAYDAKTVQQWTLLGDPSLLVGGYPTT
jgi:peptidase C25-like protein